MTASCKGPLVKFDARFTNFVQQFSLTLNSKSKNAPFKSNYLQWSTFQVLIKIINTLWLSVVVFTLHGYLFVHFIRNYGSKNLVSRVLTRLPSPQEPMERPVFGFKNQLMVHLTDITNQHFQLFSKSYQDVEYVAL